MPANGRWDLIRRLKVNAIRVDLDLQNGSIPGRTVTKKKKKWYKMNLIRWWEVSELYSRPLSKFAKEIQYYYM